MGSRPESAEWSVYMVRCRGGALYTGIACDVERRLAEHRCGAGSKYLRGRGELHLVFRQCVGSRSRALRIERAVKRLSKRRKEELVTSGCDVAELLNPSRGGRTSC